VGRFDELWGRHVNKSTFFRERMVLKSFGAIPPALPPKRQLLESYKTISITERTSSSSAVVRPIYWNPWVTGSIPMGLKFF
jgi:hypothetical protein